MKKVKVIIVSMLFLCTLNVTHVIATSGKLKTDSIVSCNGVDYGNHGDGHWHVAAQRNSGWYPQGSPVGYDNPCASKLTEEYKKSNDASLQSVWIDTESLTILDTMRYTTIKETVSIDAVPSSNKAKISIDTSQPLEIGTNYRKIKVTAEDGTMKEYILTIVREKIKSNNATLGSLLVDDKNIDVDDIIEYITKNSEVTIHAVPQDENAKISLTSPEELKIGMNKVILTITAEDGTNKEYMLNIKRLSDNIGLKVRIHGENVAFDAYKAQIKAGQKIKKSDIEYKVEDDTASVRMEYDEKNNTILFAVTAETGKFKHTKSKS